MTLPVILAMGTLFLGRSHMKPRTSKATKIVGVFQPEGEFALRVSCNWDRMWSLSVAHVDALATCMKVYMRTRSCNERIESQMRGCS